MEQEQAQMRNNHIHLMDECIQDATHLAIKHGINQEDVIATLAAALFRERTKENLTKIFCNQGTGYVK